MSNKRTPQAAAAAKVLRVKLAAARAAGRAAGHTAGQAVGFKAGRSAGFIDGSRATLRQLYKNSDRAMAVYLGQISMGREFTSADPVEIEARRIALDRAHEFEDRVILGIKKAKQVRRGQEGSLP